MYETSSKSSGALCFSSVAWSISQPSIVSRILIQYTLYHLDMQCAIALNLDKPRHLTVQTFSMIGRRPDRFCCLDGTGRSGDAMVPLDVSDPTTGSRRLVPNGSPKRSIETTSPTTVRFCGHAPGDGQRPSGPRASKNLNQSEPPAEGHSGDRFPPAGRASGRGMSPSFVRQHRSRRE